VAGGIGAAQWRADRGRTNASAGSAIFSSAKKSERQQLAVVRGGRNMLLAGVELWRCRRFRRHFIGIILIILVVLLLMGRI
jgi:hypothetical protein